MICSTVLNLHAKVRNKIAQVHRTCRNDVETGKKHMKKTFFGDLNISRNNMNWKAIDACESILID